LIAQVEAPAAAVRHRLRRELRPDWSGAGPVVPTRALGTTIGGFTRRKTIILSSNPSAPLDR